MDERRRISAPRLGRTFLKIGAAGFGGLAAVLALGEQELATRQRVVSREEITERQPVERFSKNRWLRASGRGAAPTSVGLLGATVLTLGTHALTTWLHAGIAAALALATKVKPVLILAAAAVAGMALGR